MPHDIEFYSKVRRQGAVLFASVICIYAAMVAAIVAAVLGYL